MPREYFLKSRYLWAWLLIERKQLDAFDFITNRNDAETIYENNFIMSICLFVVLSCDILIPRNLEGYMWGSKKVISFSANINWLRDYIVSFFALLVIQRYWFGADIRLTLPIFPIQDIWEHKGLRGWEIMDYHQDNWSYKLVMCIFTYFAIEKSI